MLGVTKYFLLLFACAAAEASELYGPEAGVVPFGMGRAHSAVADDWLAAHYNPAGLALVNRVDFQAFDLKVGSNRDVIQSYSNIKNLNNSSSGVAGVLNSYSGKHVKGEISNYTQFTLPGFAFGFSYEVNADVDVQNPAYPQTYMRYTKDLSFYSAGGIGFGAKKEFRLGGKIALINRQGDVDVIGVDEISGSKSSLVDKFAQKGTGWAGDIGLQYRIPTNDRTEVTTSFVWHDIGKTSFGSFSDGNTPVRREDNMVVGLGVRFPIGGKKSRRLERRFGPTRSSNHLTFAFDYSHLNYSMDKEQFPKHAHLGMNLDLPLLSLQVGLNQTSLTTGFAFDIGVLRLAFATYGEELGSYGGQRRDRRYILSLGSGLGFKGF